MEFVQCIRSLITHLKEEEKEEKIMLIEFVETNKSLTSQKKEK